MGAVDRSIFNGHVAKFLADPQYATDEGGLMSNLKGAHLRHFVQMNLPQFEKFGIDPLNEMLPIHDEQYERGGQPVIDEFLMSEIPGLFCARGAGTTGVSMGGTIATYNIPFGAYATRCAVDYIKNMDPITFIDFTPVEDEYKRLHEIRTRQVEGGIRPFAVRHQIQKTCGKCCGLLRRKEDLEAALVELKRIRTEELSRQYNRLRIETIVKEDVDKFETPYDIAETAETIWKNTNCMRCGMCNAVCPIYQTMPDKYVGPAHMLAIHYRHLDPYDQGDRIIEAVSGGLYHCIQCGMCDNVCQRDEIDHQAAWKQLRAAAEARGLKPSYAN